MPTRLKWALTRVLADFEPLGYPPFCFGESADGPVVLWQMPQASVRFLVSTTQSAEEIAYYIADQLQVFVIDEQREAWPAVNGRPLLPSADSGVACWTLDGRPWCAVGQLTAALEAR